MRALPPKKLDKNVLLYGDYSIIGAKVYNLGITYFLGSLDFSAFNVL